MTLNTDCVTCGAEAELYRSGRCLHCELNLVVDSGLADPVTGKTAPELIAICEAMKHMKRANSGLTWIKQPHVLGFFKELRGHGSVTHELLDTLPPSRTRDYVRGLLVEHGALPATTSTAIASTSGPRAPSIGSTIPTTVTSSPASSAGTSCAG